MNYDIVVVGAGPAGLTAALYGLRAGKSVLVLEGKAYGGQIVNAKEVENYPGVPSISGRDLSKNMLQQVKQLGGETKLEKVISLKNEGEQKIITTDMDEEYHAKAVIIATGAASRKLGLSNEEEYVGRGVSYCATCDGNFYRDKVVAVIGGGNTALMDAIYLASLAKKVYLIHRRGEFRAEQKYIEDAKKLSNVEFILNAVPTELGGEEKLSSITIEDKTSSEKKLLEVDGVFVAVGYEPQNQVFADVISLDELGYIQTDDGVHTNVSGVYVAGDARAKELKQLTTAVSDGAIAATTAVAEMEA